ncbi:hypothetical protein SAMN05444503_103642 [Pseudomonas sp. BS3767]|uniref:Uncharacterized protein n=1 Tax=Pseudomonas syringae TaxID=317 RepID=A0AB37ZUZ9_PSESX|nr:hypothetical protein SAMN05444503_103642 [Pseudomonas sp. BS3767]SDM60672.1 hypothetical protein SAMN05444502_102138 [Pseudomonas sp. BS3759]SDO22353.1 hypothetical protein SAMN05444505_11910 [Pseudomonas syringae]
MNETCSVSGFVSLTRQVAMGYDKICSQIRLYSYEKMLLSLIRVSYQSQLIYRL